MLPRPRRLTGPSVKLSVGVATIEVGHSSMMLSFPSHWIFYEDVAKESRVLSVALFGAASVDASAICRQMNLLTLLVTASSQTLAMSSSLFVHVCLKLCPSHRFGLIEPRTPAGRFIA